MTMSEPVVADVPLVGLGSAVLGSMMGLKRRLAVRERTHYVVPPREVHP